jgi:hypothetical protein
MVNVREVLPQLIKDFLPSLCLQELALLTRDKLAFPETDEN